MVTYHELLLNLAKTLETGCELEVVIGVCLSNGGNNGDVVTLGADTVSA
jgi:hypothetical protein